MACSVKIHYVAGIVPAGQTNPTQLRVTGEAVQCNSSQVVITSTVTAASGPIQVDNLGRFRTDLPITGTVQCGDTVTVRVECYQHPACFAQVSNEPLTCCAVDLLWFDAVGPVTSLTPTQIRVAGKAIGCQGDVVQLSSAVFATTQVPVDQFTGTFLVTLPLTAQVQCDQLVTVDAVCAQNTGCSDQLRERLVCTQCFRAVVTPVYGQCSGSPPVQPVTFNSTISIPAGQTLNMELDFGDGSVLPFTINNAGGTGATTFSRSDSHTYAQGTYTAILRVKPPSECDQITIPVNIQCQPVCPQVTVDPPAVASSCVGGKRTVTLTYHVTQGAGQQAVFQWDYGDGAQGSATVVSGNTPPAGQSEQHDYLPGSYTARLKTVLPTGCGDQTTTVNVAPCPATCPQVTLSVTTSPIPCSQGGNPVPVSFQASTSLPYTGSYTWEIKDAATATSVYKDTPVPPATTLTRPLSPGTYNVTVSIVTPGCPDPVDSDSVQITVKDCCPTFDTSATLYPSALTNCQYQFMVQGQIHNPNNVPVTYEWDFGDGTAVVTTTGPTAMHTYSTSGQRTVTVKLKSAGCPDRTLSTTVNVQCGVGPTPTTPTPSPTPSTPTPTPTSGDGIGCLLLRWIAVALFILAGALLIVALCVTGLSPQVALVLLIIAGVLAGVALILLVIWLLTCPVKPCLWGLLLTWQVTLGTGIVALYFTMCCPILWAIGGGLVLVGLILMGVWAARCRATFCQVIIELTPVLSMVIALIGWVAAIPVLAACLNPIVGGAVATISAILVIILGACAARGP